MNNQRSLAVHLEQLKPKEQLFIVWSLNFTKHLGYEVHLGMLPFVTVDDVLTMMSMWKPVGKIEERPRISAEIAAKLRQLYNVSEAKSWRMNLNNTKVARRFGAHPERGHKIPQVAKKRVTCGVRWSLPKRDFEPDTDVMVQPHVTLKNVHGCTWYITCEKQYQNHVYMFLNEHCT